MSENNRSWLRDLLAVPILVGIVVAGFTYALPKFLADSSQISYTIEEPIAYLDKSSIGTALVKVNEISVPEVFAIRVKVWNSGSLPLKNLAVLIELTTSEKDFRILSVSHNTEPAKEFGSIAEENIDSISKRLVYSLLNPKDSDTIVFLTTTKPDDVRVFSKAENLSIKAVPPEKRSDFRWSDAAILAMLGSVASTLLEIIFDSWRNRRRKAT